MKTVLLLLKKDRQIFLSENFNGKRRHDVFGALSTIILLALLYGTFIYVFYHFARFYMSATFEVQGAERARAFVRSNVAYQHFCGRKTNLFRIGKQQRLRRAYLPTHIATASVFVQTDKDLHRTNSFHVTGTVALRNCN